MSLAKPLFLRPKARSDSSSDEVDSSPSTSDNKAPKTQSRKNHTKSRRGCHNCKKRRIKCPENRPSCTHCMKRGLKCEWPDLQIYESGPEGLGSSLSSITSLQPASQGSNLTMQDFRLFYHFINEAYPHHPLNNDDIWTHEIPSIAHNHDFLLHAMLALAASELLEGDPSSTSLSCTALSHRISAITSLRTAVSRANPTVEAANAMLATCYSLIHQSALLDDGIVEFMTFTRGCVHVCFHMGMNSMPFILRNVIMGQLEMMGPHLEGEPGLEKDVVDEAVKSINAIEALCKTDGETLLYKYILETATGLYTSKRDAYIGIMHVYGCFCYEMSQPDFEVFISPSNEAGKLLQVHWVAVQSLLDSFTINEQAKRKIKVEMKSTGSMRWMRTLLRNIRPDMIFYYDWPVTHTRRVWEEQRTKGWVLPMSDEALLKAATSEMVVEHEDEVMADNRFETEGAEEDYEKVLQEFGDDNLNFCWFRDDSME